MFDFLIPEFRGGDPVYYTGEKFRQDLTKDGKPLRGWVYATIAGDPDHFVVEFPEAKDGDYILSANSLSKARPPKAEKQEGPEIQPRRRRKTEEEA